MPGEGPEQAGDHREKCGTGQQGLADRVAAAHRQRRADDRHRHGNFGETIIEAGRPRLGAATPTAGTRVHAAARRSDG